MTLDRHLPTTTYQLPYRQAPHTSVHLPTPAPPLDIRLRSRICHRRRQQPKWAGRIRESGRRERRVEADAVGENG